MAKKNKRLKNQRIWSDRERIVDRIRERGLQAKIMGDFSYQIRVTKTGARGFVDYWPTTDRFGINPVGGGTPPNSGRGFEAMITAAQKLPDLRRPAPPEIDQKMRMST